MSSAEAAPAADERPPLFRRRTVLLIAGLATLSFLAALIAWVFGPALGGRRAYGSDAYSRSALGHEALVRTLERLGVPVVVSRARSAQKVGDRGLLVVAEPDLTGDPSAAKRLRALVGRAPRALVVLPKRYVTEEDGERGHALVVGLKAASDADEVLAALGSGASVTRELDAPIGLPAPDAESWIAAPPFDSAFPTLGHPAQLLAGASRQGDLDSDLDSDLDPYVEPLVMMGEGGGVLLAALPPQPGDDEPSVYVLSDPDPLATHGLGRGDNAAFVIEVIQTLRQQAGGGPVVFDETLHGYEVEQRAWRELFRFPLGLVTIQLVLAAGALVWAGASRFGAPLPAPRAIEPGKGYLIRNTAELMGQGGHAGHVLALYANAALRQVGAALHAPRGLTTADLARWLSARDRAAGVGDDPGGGDGVGLGDGDERDGGKRAGDGVTIGAGGVEVMWREARTLGDLKDAPQARVLARARAVHKWKRETLHGS